MDYLFCLKNGKLESASGANANEAFEKTGYSENMLELIIGGKIGDNSLEWQPETQTWQARKE